MAKKSPEQVAALLAGTPTRYTPPRCHEWVDDEWTTVPLTECSHAARNPQYHWPSSGIANTSGMVRRRDTSMWLAPFKVTYGAIPARTRENIAACAAVGLSYWSEAPGTARLWAVDEHQQAHEIRIDRKAGKVQDLTGAFHEFHTPTSQQLLFHD